MLVGKLGCRGMVWVVIDGCCVALESSSWRRICVMILTKWALSRNKSSWNGKQWRKRCAMPTGEGPVGAEVFEMWVMLDGMGSWRPMEFVGNGWMGIG